MSSLFNHRRHFIDLLWLHLEDTQTKTPCFKDPKKWPISRLISEATKVQPLANNISFADYMQRGQDA